MHLLIFSKTTILLVFKIYSCLFIPICTRNHVITYTKSPKRIMPYTFVSHTNTHAIRGRPTLKDVERFRKGSILEFYGLKALKTLKNVNTSDVEKLTDLDKQNLDVEGNNNTQSTTLDKEKDVQQSNLNCKYLCLTLVLNILNVLFGFFFVINTWKRFDIA